MFRTPPFGARAHSRCARIEVLYCLGVRERRSFSERLMVFIFQGASAHFVDNLVVSSSQIPFFSNPCVRPIPQGMAICQNWRVNEAVVTNSTSTKADGEIEEYTIF